MELMDRIGRQTKKIWRGLRQPSRRHSSKKMVHQLNRIGKKQVRVL